MNEWPCHNKARSAAGLILAIIAAFLSNEMMFYSSILFFCNL